MLQLNFSQVTKPPVAEGARFQWVQPSKRTRAQPHHKPSILMTSFISIPRQEGNRHKQQNAFGISLSGIITSHSSLLLLLPKESYQTYVFASKQLVLVTSDMLLASLKNKFGMLLPRNETSHDTSLTISFLSSCTVGTIVPRLLTTLRGFSTTQDS